jgi:hypothetical protein
MGSKETRVLRICRSCQLVCHERLCACGAVPEHYYALAELPPTIAEQLRADTLTVNTPDGAKKVGE